MTRYNETIGSYERGPSPPRAASTTWVWRRAPVPVAHPVEATVRALRPADLPDVEEESRDGTHG